MRVIGGSARRRRLQSPSLPGLRPTSDRVREAIFDILASLGAIEGATVLDAFAGSGALGIEALSRGAASVTFVDSDRRALAAVRANLASTGLETSSTRLVRADAVHLLRREPGVHYDVALLDPPYTYDAWHPLLEVLDAELAVLESSRPVELAGRFVVRREYRYGGTLVTLVEEGEPGIGVSRRSGPPASGPPSDDRRDTDKDDL